jgi:hypothetical protein
MVRMLDLWEQLPTHWLLPGRTENFGTRPDESYNFPNLLLTTDWRTAVGI